MILSTARLDPTSLAYLQRVEKARGEPTPGAFYFMGSRLSRGAATAWMIVIGVAAVVIAAFLVWPGPMTETDFTTRSYWQTGLAAVGVLLLGGAALRIYRGQPRNALGSFRFFDALHMWVVSPKRVEATPLESLNDIDGTLYGGNNNYARIVLTYPTGRREFIIPSPNRTKVGFLVRYIHAMIRLRNSDDAGLRALLQSSPALLGTVAARLARGESLDNLSAMSRGDDPPQPTEVDPPRAAPARGGIVAVSMPWLAAAAVGALLFFLAPPLDRYLLDEYLFEQIPAQDSGGFTEIDAYLRKLPDGRRAQQVQDMLDERMFAHIPTSAEGGLPEINAYLERLPEGHHAPQVTEMRDHRLFAKAAHEARDGHSPSSLRRYLADVKNVLHREDAQGLINVFYDEASARLKKQAEGKEIDQSLFDAVLALLEALKKTDNPVVTVGFHPTEEPEPTTDAQKALEKAVYDLRVKAKPELARIADASPNKTAILPLGDTFSIPSMKTRQSLILDHLRESVKKVLDADIITLEPAPEVNGMESGLPGIEVAYHTSPSGGLYLYTMTAPQAVPPFGLNPLLRPKPPADEQETIKGLLRGYVVDWTITIRPPGVHKVYECKLGSKPATNLKMDSEATDPDWAPYAIILYSGFDDMSSKLIQDFGVEPPPARDTYRFSEVVHRP